jgi:hypothetical protein
MTVVQKKEFKSGVVRLASGRRPALLRVAETRVGRNPLERLRWLLGFCARSTDDFRKLSEADLAKLSVEAYVFGFSSGAHPWFARGVLYKAPE